MTIDEQIKSGGDIKITEEDFKNMWYVFHTPISRNERKVNRNEICPYCNSGKKFKNCECYKTHKIDWIQKPVFGRDNGK